MRFECPDDPTHESLSGDACSVCGASIEDFSPPTTTVHNAPAVPIVRKKGNRPPKLCIGCGVDVDSGEAECPNCQGKFFTSDPTMLPVQLQQIATSGSTTAKPAPTPPHEILEKVMRKNAAGAATPILHALLTVDLRRRDIRPVDEVPPADKTAKVFMMDQEILPFGRSSNWMEIKDPGVSRAHGEFVRQEDGSYCVKDVGSVNGVYINGQKIRPGDPRKIRPGDEIMVGFWYLIRINWST